jgi:hypothetical protein
MSTSSGTVPTASTPVPRASAPASRGWLVGALLLAGAAQLIAISALVGVDPLAVTWWSLLLAIAPAPVLAVATFAPAPASARRLVAVAGLVILVAGIAGGILHTGLFFLPALVVLAFGTVRLWREGS